MEKRTTIPERGAGGTGKTGDTGSEGAKSTILREGQLQRERTLKKWKDKLESYLGAGSGIREAGGMFHQPAHTIRVKRVVNDTELPGLSVDYEMREVAFRWCEMFQRLFSEERAIRHRIICADAWVGLNASAAIDNN